MRAWIRSGHGSNHCGLYHPLQVLAGGDGVDGGDEGTARARHIYPELLKQGERHDTELRNSKRGGVELGPRPNTVDAEVKAGRQGQVPGGLPWKSPAQPKIKQIFSIPGLCARSVPFLES